MRGSKPAGFGKKCLVSAALRSSLAFGASPGEGQICYKVKSPAETP